MKTSERLPLSQRSPALRFLSWFFTPARLRKILKRTAITVAVLLVLAFVFSWEEAWRGRRAWERTKAAAEAEGMDFNWQHDVPAPVPDGENLVCAPVMTGSYRADGASRPATWLKESPLTKAVETRSVVLNKYFGEWEFGEPAPEAQKWQEGLRKSDESNKRSRKSSTGLPQLPRNVWADAEDVLAPIQPLLAQVREACEARPQSCFPGNYSLPFAAPIPAFNLVREYSRLLFADAMVALHEGDSQRALSDVHAMTRLATLGEEPAFLINVMIRVIIMRMASNVLAYGLAEECFDGSQLREIVHLAAKTKLVLALGESMNVECVGVVHTLASHIASAGGQDYGGNSGLLVTDMTPSLSPWMAQVLWYLTPAEGWNLQMIARYVECKMSLSPSFDGNQVNYPLFEKTCAELNDRLEDAAFFDRLASLAMPAYKKVTDQTIDGQCKIDIVGWTAAVELYRLQHGELPESLDEIDLGEEVSLPKDAPIGVPYAYRREGGEFEISVTPAADLDPVRLAIRDPALSQEED